MRIVSAHGPLYKHHPWHGVPIGSEAPPLVTCYIEIVPTDTLKYELDNLTGHLKIDRPQKYSSVCPTLYGLLPLDVIERSREDHLECFSEAKDWPELEAV